MMPRAPRPRPDAIPPRPSAAVHSAAPAGGRPLEPHTQSRMSARFGHDFSQVRIHTDDRAAVAADAAGANAFARGSDVVFGAGRYAPGSPETERLLSHELTHVVQQARHGPGDPARSSDRGDASEQEAERAAADVAAGRDVDVRARPGAAIARDGGLLDMFSKTWGDWKFSPQLPPPTSTDSSHDQQPGQQQDNERARRQQEDADAARRAGETDPRPEWWKLPPFAPPAMKPAPTFPGVPPSLGPELGPSGGPYPLPAPKPWTPTPFTGPPPPGGLQLTPPTFDPYPAPKPPLLGSDLPPLHLDPIPGLTPGVSAADQP